MATIEKLIKAFEALKVFQPGGNTSDDSKKKDQTVSKKDKMINCNIVADCICAPNMRAIIDFPKFLGIAMETFLNLCDDAESDVRMVADECINRSIKVLLETNLGRLQVELYKEIKKNGSSRTLRAALWRFAEMAPLIRPQKCRPYMVNMLPCLARICKREEEAVQETLLSSMVKICPALMVFANESEIKVLLKSFLPNLKSPSASCRRTAATSLVLICQYSRSPTSFYNYLLNVLLDMVLPVDGDQDLHTLMGVVLCMRSLVPHLGEASLSEQGMKGSFGVMTKEKTESVSKEQLIKVIQMLLHLMTHRDHNVVTSALEAFQQLLRNPTPLLVSILTVPGTITRTLVYLADQASSPSNDSLQEVPSFSKLAEESGLEDDTDIPDPLADPAGESSSDSSSFVYNTFVARGEEPGAVGGSDGTSPVDTQVIVTTTDSEYSGIEIGDLNEDKSEKSNMTQVCSSSQETLLSIQSISPTRKPSLQKGVSQDLNGNPEIEDVFVEGDRSLLPSPGEDVSACIGSIIDKQPAIVYCIRFIASRFLLSGCRRVLKPDKTVRVSVKSLALTCVSSAVAMYPQLFLLNLFTDVTQDLDQEIQDVLLYANHPDPQLKGNTTQIAANLIMAALKESRGNFIKWLSDSPGKVTDLSVQSLVDIILDIVEDSSSVAVRLAIISLQTCISPLLQSVHSELALLILLKLMEVKDNPYWLVKTELLELLSDISFKILVHLELCCTVAQRGQHHFLGKLNLQHRVIHNVVIPLLGNEDHRVRHSAAQTLVKLIPQLFYSADHCQQDPVIAVAKDHTGNLLTPDHSPDSPPLVQGLVKPFHLGADHVTNIYVESNLSRVIMALLHELNLSNVKHNTYGCCHALCLLSECFPATQYAHSWGCGPPTPLVPRDSTNRMVMRRPPSRSLSGSSTFSLDEMLGGSGGGPLTIMLSLLTSSLVSLDLLAHHDTLKLAGNLVSGAAYKCLRNIESYNNTTDNSEDTKWQGIADRVLFPLIEQFLTHIARLLNACCHVIDEQLPGPPQIKPSLPSLPTAPSLSPIKRKAKGEKDGNAPGTPGSSEKSTPKQQKDKDKEPERERNKKDGLGTFYSLPQYMKLYEVLRGAYSTYKISLDLGSSDKFCVLLKCALECLAQVLEIASLQDIGKYADELLGYLRTTVSLEPTCTILCVQQLLKALFGTNLVSQWEPQQATNISHKPGKATRMSSNSRPGLYSHCFTQPYSHFTQSLAAATFKANAQTEQEEATSMLNWLKKCVERKLPAILKPGSKTDKAAIAAYIRLFEPLVIKALKQYTVTSCLELQRQVLDLLSQLIQLRVNYCLLDSDQVFIGFIIKQIEFIEEGQIRNSESLIPNLFNFLVMLSYEKYHSKSIIGMPKIIQLCDGIMASGLHPTSHAIPALKPIVYDLFLLRAANKSDISRELETQREVVVSMLLRLIHYHETLDLLVIVLQQCHKESEERWKKLSRQVTDTILPSLARQQVTIDSMAALETLHRLFESLAPIVFRPVDILLKTLLQEPADVTTVENLQRWVSLVLSVLRVLMAQSKEEVILSRMQELGLGLNVFKVPSREMTTEERDLALALAPEGVIAWFLIQVIGNCASFISQKCELTGHSSSSSSSTLFLTQQLSHLLLYVTHMFQSGLFRKVATSAMKSSHLDTPHCYHSIQQLNHMFLSVSMTLPTLTLQWCNILILLNFDDQSLWSTVMQTPKRFLKPGSSQSCDLEVQASPMTHCCNLEILRRGGLVLFCDYVCENLTEAEHMTWLVINHVSDIISLSQESPVQDFVSAIHRNSSASSLFIQAIHARCENVSKPSLVRKTMKCLEAIHLSQTGSLLTLLIDKFLNTHHLAVARICDSIACKRVEMLLADSVQDAFKQLPLEDLDKLLKYMETNKLIKRHARLVSLLQKLRVEIEPEGVADLIREKPHPLSVPENLSDIQINKECYVSIVKNQCFSVNCNPRACAKLLHHLTYADVLSITMTKEFNLCILPECILLGAHHTLLKNNDSSDILDTEGNKIPQEPVFDPLLQAAQLTLIRHINNIINMLPTPHQIVKYGSDSKTAKRTRYLEKMDDFFSDTSWSDMVFNLVSSLNIYIQTLSTFPWQPEVPAESHCDIVQFCVLCAEMVDWMFHHDLLPTCERLHSCLHCMSLILQHPQLSVVIGQKQHTSWMCSLTGTAYQTVYSLLVVPGEKLVSTPAPGDHSKETLNDLIIQACDQVSELVEFSQRHLSGGSQIIPSFLQQNLRNIITGLGRQPVLNSYARTPSIVWKMGWIPSPNGEPKTKLPPLPVDFLEDKDVLREYIFRINSLGWINRQQFEETWMSLLSVVNPVTMPSNGEEMVVSPEEEMERAQCTVMAVRAITSLLIQSTLIPVPGNTSYSSYEIRPRDKPLGFLHTRCGKKLTVIRGVIEQEVHNLHSRRSVRSGSTSDEKDLLRYMFDSNLEREIMADDYTLGQIAIEAIWSVVGALDFHVAESDTTDSLESPTTDSPDTPGRPRQQFPLLSFERERRERSVNLSGLDIHSCLQFLLELYGQWMLTNPRPPLMLKNEVVKSIVCLSDLFMEREQYDWMQEVLLDLYKTHPQEDEVLMQYLNVGICKAAAVVGMDNSTTEKLMKIIDAGFRSPHLPSRIGALHGTLYLLEAGIQDVTKLLVPLATDFLLRNLSTVSQTCITSQNYMLTMWSTAFYIMENYHIDLKDLEFPSKVLQLAVITASGSEDSVSTAVYLAILKGLERLLLTDVLSKQDAEAIIKLGVDRLCLPSPQRSLAALGLMFTCMYSGKQYDQYSPSPREVEPGTTAYDFEVVYQDPESLILAMERVTVLFDRIKKGYPYEARVISRVLPTFLADFFPPQDVMNKVIGEFISSQQPYPQVVAKVVFQVFANLHQQKQQTLVRDWVMLSLSNFTQRTPIAMAMWSLTCFFISASVNPWLRALFTHVIGRMGRMDVVDRRLFCITAMDFYDQLTDDGQRRAFTSTFMAVSQPGSVYQELLQHINSLSKS